MRPCNINGRFFSLSFTCVYLNGTIRLDIVLVIWFRTSLLFWLWIGATNRPQELDEAARRRLTKRLYIPLPSSGMDVLFSFCGYMLWNISYFFDDEDARAWIIQNLLDKDGLFKLGKEDIASICKLTDGNILRQIIILFVSIYICDFYVWKFIDKYSNQGYFKFQGTQVQTWRIL